MATTKNKKALAARRKSQTAKPVAKSKPAPKPKPKAKAKAASKPRPRVKPAPKKEDEEFAVIPPGAFGSGRKKKKARA